MRPLVGFYIHHVGHGHLHRAAGLAHAVTEAGCDLAGLSSLPRPEDWPGEWIQLERDDQPVPTDTDPTANGRLHWVPRQHPGLRSRMASISAWIARTAPSVMVVDVSVEVTLLARLHGVPVISVVLPGRRDDPAHLGGFDAADEVVGFWPGPAEAFLPGLPSRLQERVRPMGAIARFPVNEEPATDNRRVVMLLGSGGHSITESMLRVAQQQTPDWSWTVLSVQRGWSDDPWSHVLASCVVITHAGEGALAEVAAARRPAVVLPQQRPYDEQQVTAAALRAGDWPVTVLEEWPSSGWSSILDRTASLDGRCWEDWCDGAAGDRFAGLLTDMASRIGVGG